MSDQLIVQNSEMGSSPVRDEEPFTVNEIIGNSPGWILHSGMTLVLVVVSIGIGMTFVISYPDKIMAPGVITTTDPYKPVTSKTTGIVDAVFQDNHTPVNEGDPILYIENTANLSDVEFVSGKIDALDKLLRQNGRIFPFPERSLSLGPMQTSYASLEQQVTEYVHFANLAEYRLKLSAIDREIGELEYMNDVLLQDKALTKAEVSLSHKDLDRNQFLFENGIISERDLEVSQASNLSVQRNYLNKDNNLTQNRIRIAGLEQSKAEISAARMERILLYQSRIHESILNYRNVYNNWFHQYYVCAPDDGILQLASSLVSGQTIQSGNILGYVIPQTSTGAFGADTLNSIYGKVLVPSVGIGKIKKGNRAIIHVDAYPYKEFGTLEAEVATISSIAEKLPDAGQFYELHLDLEPDLRTDYGQVITYSPDMTIQVSIITEERSLFQRIFEQFFNLINQHIS